MVSESRFSLCPSERWYLWHGEETLAPFWGICSRQERRCKPHTSKPPSVVHLSGQRSKALQSHARPELEWGGGPKGFGGEGGCKRGVLESAWEGGEQSSKPTPGRAAMKLSFGAPGPPPRTPTARNAPAFGVLGRASGPPAGQASRQQVQGESAGREDEEQAEEGTHVGGRENQSGTAS